MLLRVPDRHIGVAADRDRAFPRVEAIQLGVVCRGQRDKAVEIDAALPDALGKQQRHAQLDARHPVGGVLECCLIPLQKLAGLIVAIGRMIGGEHLEGAVGEAAPHGLLRRLVARRWRAAEFRAFEIHADVIGGQKQILRAGLAVDLEPLRLRVANDVDRLGGRDVHDQERDIEQLGQRDGAVCRFALGDTGMRDRVVARLR